MFSSKVGTSDWCSNARQLICVYRMGKHILVVEDNMIIGLVTQRILISAGYDVPELLTSGQEAVAYCKGTCPDLVLMDIQLEGGADGVETMLEIRSFCQCPVIYLTGNSEIKSREKAALIGFNGFLVKPVQRQELLDTVGNVWA